MSRYAVKTGAVLLFFLATALPWMLSGFAPFVGHMMGHMILVTLVPPLLVLAAPGRLKGFAVPALLGAVIEFVMVWGWHLPGLHVAARSLPAAFLLEQLSFLGAGLAVWSGALNAREPLVGAFALFLTAMHMTALGALLILAGADLYGYGLAGQQVGGMLMIAVGTPACWLGGLWLTARRLTGHGLRERGLTEDSA